MCRCRKDEPRPRFPFNKLWDGVILFLALLGSGLCLEFVREVRARPASGPKQQQSEQPRPEKPAP